MLYFFWQVVEGETESIHQRLYTVFGRFGAVRDAQWHYFQHIRGEDPSKGPCLYDLNNDPQEQRNVIEQHPEIAAKMSKQLEDRLGIELPPI
jgi:arylsulfatase A-like enzyme